MSFLDSPVLAFAALEPQPINFIPGAATQAHIHRIAKTVDRPGAHLRAGADFQARVADWIYSGTIS